VSICRSECLVASGEEKQKTSSEVRHSNLLDCGNLSTRKRDFLKGNIPYIFRIEHWKDNGIPFTNLVTFACIIKSYLFKDPITIFQIPLFNMTISTFIYWKIPQFSFPNQWFMSCVHIDFIFCILPGISSYLIFEKPSRIFSFSRSFSLEISPRQSSVFQFYTSP